MNLDILDKFTSHLRNSLSRSIDVAWELQYASIQPVFVLFGIVEQKGSIGSQVLLKHNLTGEVLEAFIREQVDADPVAARDDSILLWPEFAEPTKKMIEHAAVLAFELRHQFIGTEHMLLSILSVSDPSVQAVVKQAEASLDEMRKQLMGMMNSTGTFSAMQGLFGQQGMPGQQGAHSQQGSPGPAGSPAQPGMTDPQGGATVMQPDMAEEISETPALDFFGIDLTSAEQLEKLDPVIGRQKEIDRLVHVLSRRTKNNPVLVGDPGVGKTAIAEGLAKRIAEGSVPDVLLDKRVVALDLSLILSGTMYRGEFESRIKQVIEELQTHPEIILFIDEVHMIVGAGSVQGGTMDAANIFKPALAKGTLRCIGATTSDEYRKHIEQDPALERRFQPISVDEPTQKEAVEILQGLREYYEQYHHVAIPDDVIEAAVRLSGRFMPDKFLPDKAIDLVDEAGAKAHVQQKVPKVLKDLDNVHRTLKQLRQKKEQAVRTERFSLAVDLKKKERVCLDKIEALEKKAEGMELPATELTVENIAQVIAGMTSIPMENILTRDNVRSGNLEQQLLEHIVGQDDAVKRVASVLKRSYAGLSSPDRPLGSFLFLGPSGVGKTELAKVLASGHFGDRSSLIRMDMSEFSEGFTVSKLIGAPAGYVGYNEQVKLGDQIRKKPYSVVLFDEIEKAHPDIFNLLLQILDEGRLTDSAGRELNFRNSVIIMTSNIGIDLLTKQAAIGFDTGGGEQKKKGAATKQSHRDDVEQVITGELQEAFPLEFLNRIDHQIIFRPLTTASVEKIVDLQFAGVKERLAERGVAARLLSSAKKHIARESFSPDQGARRVRQMVQGLIEEPLADMILDGKLPPKSSVKVKAENGKIILEPTKPKR